MWPSIAAVLGWPLCGSSTLVMQGFWMIGLSGTGKAQVILPSTARWTSGLGIFRKKPMLGAWHKQLLGCGMAGDPVILPFSAWTCRCMVFSLGAFLGQRRTEPQWPKWLELRRRRGCWEVTRAKSCCCGICWTKIHKIPKGCESNPGYDLEVKQALGEQRLGWVVFTVSLLPVTKWPLSCHL